MSTASTGQKAWNWSGINVKKANPLRLKGKRVEEPTVDGTTYTKIAATRKSSAAVSTRRPLYTASPAKKITIKSP